MGLCVRPKHFLFLKPPAMARGWISSRNHLSPLQACITRVSTDRASARRAADSQLADRLITVLAALRPQLRPQPTKPPWAIARASRSAGGFSDRQRLLPITVTQSHGLRSGQAGPRQRYCHCCPHLGTLCAGLPRPRQGWRGLRHAREVSATLPKAAGGSQEGVVWQRETGKYG